MVTFRWSPSSFLDSFRYISIPPCCLHPRNLTYPQLLFVEAYLSIQGGSSGTKTTPVQHPHCVQNTLCTVHICTQGKQQGSFHRTLGMHVNPGTLIHPLIHQQLDFCPLYLQTRLPRSDYAPLKLQALHNDLIRESPPIFPFRGRQDSQHTNSSPKNALFFPKSSFLLL